MFPISMAPGPHSSISEGFLHSIILRPKKPLGSWNLVNPLLSMNKAWMDECAARLQPLVDQYKPRQHQTFAIEKFRDLIVTTRSCPGNKQNKKILKSQKNVKTAKPSRKRILNLETFKSLISCFCLGKPLVLKHIMALEIKRFHHSKRNKKGFMCEVGSN